MVALRLLPEYPGPQGGKKRYIPSRDGFEFLRRQFAAIRRLFFSLDRHVNAPSLSRAACPLRFHVGVKVCTSPDSPAGLCARCNTGAASPNAVRDARRLRLRRASGGLVQSYVAACELPVLRDCGCAFVLVRAIFGDRFRNAHFESVLGEASDDAANHKAVARSPAI